ncbi:MAG TPA: DUF4249 family protein [Chryseosolibacter sp.]|nr:DUF4249 family protein [Chryseosolibacter sp.]
MRLAKHLMFILLFVGCEEKTDVPLAPEDTGLLVVEGVLTNENKNHLVKLTLPYGQPNGSAKPATGASVFIVLDTVYSLTEFPAGSGRYYTPVGRAVAGKMYTLVIQYNGKQYRAQDGAVPVEPMQELKYRENAEGYSLILNPDGADPNYIQHFITWRHTSACSASGACEGGIVYYDLKTIDVNEIYKPEKAPFHFPRQSIVIRKKYSVSPAYRSFLRSMLSETEWRGGVFDVQRSNVTTNLTDGAVGFFAVCSVVSDTTIVN